jgi:hypothetical protein
MYQAQPNKGEIYTARETNTRPQNVLIIKVEPFMQTQHISYVGINSIETTQKLATAVKIMHLAQFLSYYKPHPTASYKTPTAEQPNRGSRSGVGSGHHNNHKGGRPYKTDPQEPPTLTQEQLDRLVQQFTQALLKQRPS